MMPRSKIQRARNGAVPRDLLDLPWPPTITEWLTIMRRTQVNGMLVAPAPVTDAVLGALETTWSQPLLERWRDGTPWDGEQQLHTLVLHDVIALSPREQQSLFAWMNGRGRDCRVVSIACLPVFPLVEDGDFLAPLYYRLNVVYAEDRSGA
jgi:hypothetical protein